MKGDKNACKYNKVTQQKKFHLLTLVIKDKLLIKEAARRVGINYSTAKTIIFFNRNQAKTYQFDFQTAPRHRAYARKRIASISDLPHLVPEGSIRPKPNQLINIVSTIGSKNLHETSEECERKNFESSSNIQISHSQLNDYEAGYAPDHWTEVKQLNAPVGERRITRALSAHQHVQPTSQSPFQVTENYDSSNRRSEEYKNG